MLILYKYYLVLHVTDRLYAIADKLEHDGTQLQRIFQRIQTHKLNVGGSPNRNSSEHINDISANCCIKGIN